MTNGNTCTLPSHEYSGRMLPIAELNRDALEQVERMLRELRLYYRKDAEARVREFVRTESACCGFLTFEVAVREAQVVATIVAPADAEAAAQPLFDQFAAKEATGAGCACSGAAAPPKVIGGGAAQVAVKTSAAAAIACGVCCLVPFVFPAVALTTTGAGIAALAGVYWWAIRLAFLALAAGWLWLLVDSVRRGRRPGRATVVAMASATAFTFLAYSWSFAERHVIAWIKQI